MSCWTTATLGNAIELAYGKSLPKGDRVEGGKVPVYGSNGITGWHSEALTEDATIIVGRKGSAGAVQFVDQPCFPIDTTYFVRARAGFEFDTKFLYYLLLRLDLARLRTATGVPGLTREDAYREVISFPDIEEQHRIVDLLTRAEGIVRLRREAAAKAAELVPAIFIDMFGDPAKNPKRWPTSPLGELATLTSGGTPSKSRPDYWEGDLPWVSPKDMKRDLINDAIDHVHPKVLDETTLKLIPAGTVLIVVRGMILVHTVPVALTATPLVINQDMKALQLKSELSSTYLLWLLKVSQPRLLELVSTAAHGTKKLETKDLVALKIPLPPMALQRQFLERVQAIESILVQQANAIEKAQATFNALLAQAFSPPTSSALTQE